MRRRLRSGSQPTTSARRLVDYAAVCPDPAYRAGELPVIFSCDHKIDLLPHFLAHYRAQGATDFLCVAWAGADPDRVCAALEDAGAPGLLVRPGVSFYLGYTDSHLHDQIRLAHVDPAGWYLVADLDEFHRIPGYSLRSAVAAAASDGASVIAGEFLDRITRDGSLPETLTTDIETQFPLRTRMTQRVKTAATEKVIAARGDIAIHSGHHRHEGLEWCVRGDVHHFAWWGDLRERMELRIDRVRESGQAWGGECVALLDALDANGDRLPLVHAPLREVPEKWRTR